MLARSLGLASLAVLTWLPLGCAPPSAPPLRPSALAKPAVSAFASAGPSVQPDESAPFPELQDERPAGPAPKIVSIAVSVGGTCAVEEQGRLYCWGMRVPDGNGGDRVALRPVQIQGIDDALEVQGGSTTSGFCVLRRSHPLACWSIGVFDNSYPFAMIEVPQLHPARAEQLVLSGSRWACVLGADGKASCVDDSGPAQIVPPDWGAIRSLGVAAKDLMAVTSKGFRCTGPGEMEACPFGASKARRVKLVLPGLRQVSASGSMGCALGAADVLCWGPDINVGQKPRPVPALRGAKLIAVEGDGSVDGLFADGRVVRFTVGAEGERPPKTVIESGATNLVAGASHACALLHDGQVRCWGKADNGNLGDNSLAIVKRPRPLEGISEARRLWLRDGPMVLRSNGSVLALKDKLAEQPVWQDVSQGPVSDEIVLCPSPPGAAEPTFVRGPTGSVHCDVEPLEGAIESVTSISYLPKGSLTCARFPDTTVRCKGGFELPSKQGKREPIGKHPETVLASHAMGLRAGSLGICALLRDGFAQCFFETAAELFGARAGKPFRLPSGRGVQDISLGVKQACAVDTAGTVYCDDSVSGGKVHRLEGLPPVRSLVSGTIHTCALTVLGHVYCWGTNRSGELGVGDNASHAEPVRAWGLTNVVELAAERSATCARTESGSVYCWGENRFGQIGLPKPKRDSPPVTPLW